MVVIETGKKNKSTKEEDVIQRLSFSHFLNFPFLSHGGLVSYGAEGKRSLRFLLFPPPPPPLWPPSILEARVRAMRPSISLLKLARISCSSSPSDCGEGGAAGKRTEAGVGAAFSSPLPLPLPLLLELSLRFLPFPPP